MDNAWYIRGRVERFVLALLLVAVCEWVGDGGVAFADEGKPRSQFVYKTVGERKLTMDVDYPPDWKASDKRPVLVFFFGGGWTKGAPDRFRPQAEYFAKRGLVCARADYRLREKDGVLPDKCVEDAVSAMRWVRGRAAELGADPDRIVAVGGSAGGHLAACTYFIEGVESAEDDKSVSPKPNAMILYNPALDLVEWRAKEATGRDVAKVFRGLSVERREQISPLRHLRKGAPPTLVMDGTKDWLGGQTRDFVEKSKALGSPVEVYYAEGQLHGFFNKSPWLQKTTAEADRFLRGIGYLKDEPKVELPARGVDDGAAPVKRRRGK